MDNSFAENFKSAQKSAWTSVAEDWHTGLAPSLIPVTRRLLQFTALPKETKILDLACGDGTLSLEALSNGISQVVAADIAPTFGPILQRRAVEAGFTNRIHFQEADMENLPFQEKEFDAVLCQFGIIFSPNIKRALQEIYRVLKPQGIFGAAVWGTAEENPPVAEMLQILNSHLPPRPEGLPSLFDFGKPGFMQEALKSVGFREYKELHFDVTFHHKDKDAAWHAWKNNGPVASAMAQWDQKTQKAVERSMRKVHSKHKVRGGKIEIPAKALLISVKRGFETLSH